MVKNVAFLFIILMLVLIPASCAKKDNRKVLYYVNPMDPEIRYDKPAKDPMGMDFIPVYEDDISSDSKKIEKEMVEGYTDVNVPYLKQQLIGVKYGIVERKYMNRIIRAIGKVSHDTELYNTIHEYFNILDYYNKTVISNSTESINSAKAMVESVKFKLKRLGFDESEIRKLKAGNNFDQSLLISDTNYRSWIDANISETNIIHIKTGLNAIISIPSIPDKKFTGKIITIDPVLDIETRTIKARILLDKTEIVLKHEIYVNIDIESPAGNKLVIPEDAVMDSGMRQIVFVARENGNFEPREVILGSKINDFYEVLSGVKENEKVVTSANFLIDSESRLKAALKDIGE